MSNTHTYYDIIDACKTGKEQVIKQCLVSTCILPNQALRVASENGHLKVVQCLVDYGAIQRRTW